MPVLSMFDSNIIIDALNRHRPAFDALKAFSDGATMISRISWIEIVAGASPDHLAATEAYLRGCTVIELTPDIAGRAAEVRRQTRLKLPDAIILATALITDRQLVTRDRNFPPDWPGIHHPYEWAAKPEP